MRASQPAGRASQARSREASAPGPNAAIKLERLLAAFAPYNTSETTVAVTC
jgi:hypothetical protein